MTLAIQDHIYLDTSNPPTDTYPVAAEGLDWTPMVAVTTERSLTGKLHIHRLVDGGGDPVSFRSDRLRLITTLAQMLTLRGASGKTVYYVPNYHDPDNLAAYTHESILVIPEGAITNIDPMCTYWFVSVRLVDDEAI